MINERKVDENSCTANADDWVRKKENKARY